MCQNRYLTTILRDLIKFLIRNCTIFILKPSIYTIHLDRMNRCAKQFFTNNKIELISNNEVRTDCYMYIVYISREYLTQFIKCTLANETWKSMEKFRESRGLSRCQRERESCSSKWSSRWVSERKGMGERS